MTASLSAWWAGLVASPLSLAAAAAAVIVWAIATSRIWPRIPGHAWRAAWAVLAVGYLLATVGFIAPPPERRAAGQPVLVTTGADAGALQDVADASDVFVTGRAWREPAVVAWVRARVRGAAPGRTVRISMIDDVALYGTPPRVLRVIGDGLSADAWAASEWRGAIEFVPPVMGSGIASAEWPRLLDAGLTLSVEVAATDAVPTGASFALRDADGGALARVPASAGRIEGPALPEGRHVLTLSLERGDAVLERINLPIVVRSPQPARVLALQAAPSFEWRALGRWLARAGARVATRSRVSEARFRDRFVAMPERVLSPIDDGVLGAFDLVIVDGAALATLSTEERQLLIAGTHGAGVLVLLHDEDDVEALPERLRAAIGGDPARETVYQLAASAGVLETGLSRLALTFEDGAGEALLRDVGGVPVVARVSPGDRVALSLLRDSYRLSGVGAGAAHARLWSQLVLGLSRAARPRDASIRPDGTRVGERLRVCLPAATADESVVLRYGSGARLDLPLTRTPWRPAERCGWAWPDEAGWLTVTRVGPDADTPAIGSHWVEPRGPLSTRERLARVAATRERMARSDDAADEGRLPTSPMPRDRFFVALLALALLTALSERLAVARRRQASP